MKIGCQCGETISDTSDYLSHKGHLTPDQSLYDVYDAIDQEVIDRVATADLSIDDAYMKARNLISRPTRLMWQCFECARLYIVGPDGTMHCYVPADPETERRVLRATGSK